MTRHEEQEALNLSLSGSDDLPGIDGLDGIDEAEVAAMAALFDTTEAAAADELAVARLARFAREGAMAAAPARVEQGASAATIGEVAPAKTGRALRWLGFALAATLAGLAVRAALPAAAVEPAVAPELALAITTRGADGDASWGGSDPLDFFGTSATYAQADLLPDEFDEAWADDLR